MTPSKDIARLIEIMAALRTPVTGCPWDIEQSFASIAPYTIEEAYEVVDAIERGDIVDLKDELGDLLLQVVFHAQMASEAGQFAFPDVVEAITSKLIRRHPHVFGDLTALEPAAVKALWGQIKAQEKAERVTARREAGLPETDQGMLSDVPRALPALTRAVKLQAKAGKVGFDWNDPQAVMAKVHEETAEIAEAMARGNKQDAAEEIGDLLFVIANLARHLEIDPEAALSGANAKFKRRFGHIEDTLKRRGTGFEGVLLDEMEALWLEAKHLEKAKPKSG
jgi:nucleoside triphosphate diphosphatase